MKQFLIIGFTLIATQICGQSSLDSTTTWKYSIWNFGISEPDSLYVSGDTTINGIKWYTLDGDGSCAFPNPDSLPFIREEDNKWLVYDINRQKESTLYDFDLIEGESYLVNTLGPNFQIDVRIDSVRTKQLNGIDYRVQYCSNPIASTEGFFFAFEVIEGIGSTGYLFPQGNICVPQTGPIRCFANSAEFVDFDPDRDCDEIYFPSSIAELEDEIDIQIYPNPSTLNEDIICNSVKKISEIEIINQSGMTIISQTNNSNRSVINLTESGIYFVRLKIENQTVVKKVIVKANK